MCGQHKACVLLYEKHASFCFGWQIQESEQRTGGKSSGQSADLLIACNVVFAAPSTALAAVLVAFPTAEAVVFAALSTALVAVVTPLVMELPRSLMKFALQCLPRTLSVTINRIRQRSIAQPFAAAAGALSYDKAWKSDGTDKQEPLIPGPQSYFGKVAGDTKLGREVSLCQRSV